MSRTLHFSLADDRLHRAFATLDQAVTRDGRRRGCELYTANALWGQRGERFLPGFLHLVRENYGGGLEEVDFRNAAEEARQTINAWVEQQTRSKIKDLIPPEVLTPATTLVLTNAVYFKGKWSQPFAKRLTRQEPFFVARDRSVDVSMMHAEESFRYAEDPDVQVLELPYEGDTLSLVAILPRTKDGLPHLERNLSAHRLSRWVGQLESKEVGVSLPKFRLTKEFKLSKELTSLGMIQAFSTKADFSGMNEQHDLHISEVVHKAFVELNEEGTEAAAATGVVIAKPAARAETTFRADHPFLFLIRHVPSGSILFLGRVGDPT
jgi:serpin B